MVAVVEKRGHTDATKKGTHMVEVLASRRG